MAASCPCFLAGVTSSGICFACTFGWVRIAVWVRCRFIRNVPQPVVAHICDVYNWEMRLACAEADGAVGSSVFEFKIGPGAIRAGRDYYAGIRAEWQCCSCCCDVASWRGTYAVMRRHCLVRVGLFCRNWLLGCQNTVMLTLRV